ncbi:hypothetical protein [Actinokineospora bangkokensis]|uniref:Uncharacterized protein n=1 Tax=Actinokineospora bangkokensis TaxID=1193682 RepID=A0A1Q9LSK7_9PSEU|nr:hypothetical protein [Actinokineospora bangkokensis]OLR94993.1 hypothetical protein BJP25_08495 [Actinokineospora bangkokensis]
MTDTPIFDQVSQELGSSGGSDTGDPAPRGARRQSGARAAGGTGGVSVWALIDEHGSTPTRRRT